MKSRIATLLVLTSSLVLQEQFAHADPASSPSPAPIPTSAATPYAPSVNVSEVANAAPGTQILSMEKQDGRTLTLEDSIKLAIRSASNVLKAENDLQFNGARLLQAYGQFLPSVYGTGSYNYTTGTTYSTAVTPTLVKGSNLNAGYSLAASLNLFNGLSDFANLKSSILKKDAAELTVARAKQEISLDIAQSYLQVILDNKLVDIARKNFQVSQERERLLQEQTEVGSRNLADLFRQQAQTSVDESSLLAAENRTRSDQIILLRKLRLDVAPSYKFAEPNLKEETDQGKTLDENVLVARAFDLRKDLKASTDVADATDWDVHLASSNYLPKIDLVGQMLGGAHDLQSQSVNGVDIVPPSQLALGTQLGRQIDYTVGVQLTWSLFDRFLTHQNVSRARAIANDSAIDAQDRKLQVEGDVRRAYGDYITSVQQLRASKKGIDAAQKAYEVMEGRYEVGSASFLDLIAAQTVLVQAQSNRVQAVINFQLQDRSLEFAVGDLATD